MPGKPIKYVHNYGADIQEKLPEEMPKRPILGDTPINSFVSFIKNYWRAESEFDNWMMLSPEMRLSKTRKYADDKKDMNRRHEILNFITYVESAFEGRGGDSKVAAIAFRALFPEHNKGLMDEAANAS